MAAPSAQPCIGWSAGAALSRGGQSARLAHFGCTGQPYDCLRKEAGAKAALVSYADEVEDTLEAADQLAQQGIPCDVYKLVQIWPLSQELVADLESYSLILMAEECVVRGGIGEHLEAAMRQAGWQGKYLHRGVTQPQLPHATVPQIKQVLGLDGQSLAKDIQQAV